MFKYIFSIVISILIIGCSYIPSIEKRQQELYQLLISLDYHISKNEAKRLSKDIIHFSKQLKENYQPIIEPHFNNFLVNIGLKSHGLCYEWSDSLYIYLLRQHYNGFEFHLVVSDKGKYWSEHNALVIMPKGKNLSQGIVIDLWRDIDDISFIKIPDDKKYQWTIREGY